MTHCSVEGDYTVIRVASVSQKLALQIPKYSIIDRVMMLVNTQHDERCSISHIHILI